MVLLAGLLAACSGTSAVDTDAANGPQLKSLRAVSTGILPVAERRAAPVLRGSTLEGDALDIADLRGQVVVVNFWASWCPPCRTEAPHLIKVAKDMSGQGVRFVGINIKDSQDAALRFQQRRAVPYPSLFDQPGILLTRFRRYVPQQPPSTLLLDRQGRVAGLLHGGVLADELATPVAALAAERP
ncbi:MAG TPA: TlpA disulfide reductase family protein [Mycobacteriales bacterium]|nr:TlpA disulfide reductase family protein [Mycobacteriales bacterium]